MSNTIDQAMTYVMTAAAIAVAVSLVHREFFSGFPGGQPGRNSPKPVYVSDWKTMIPSGITLGNTAAPVKIIEFADFECEECRAFEATIKELQRQYGDSVAVVFVDYPSPRHRFARAAAQAAECADQQGKFPSFHDMVYEKQDSIGLKPWASYAVEAGVADTTSFARCATDTKEPPRIVAASALGIKANVGFAPTILVNGWRFARPPTDSVLSTAVAALLAGQTPF